jgi:hypothetical protein
VISGEWCEEAVLACATSVPTFFDLMKENYKNKRISEGSQPFFSGI